ncbi:unnamed protein product [Mytilus coruscus]|uniref:Cadherin domain-containing protein n=1 Tax=Mytilus coruscus TaxID=42192 RepID=A0A6J8E5E2_MYTCO|nr:unnamed protein product [Mytilus coruscus]
MIDAFVDSRYKSLSSQSIQPPRWNNDIHQTYLKPENLSIGSELATISAVGQNGVAVTLTIYGTETERRVFLNSTTDSINTVGTVYLKEEMDREVREEKLTLYITDVNDNAPKFKEPFYQQEVTENASQGYIHVVTEITASDPDTSGGGQILFKLKDKDPDRPLSSNVTLVIKVKDIQDSPPYFQGLPYVTKIVENANLNTRLPIQGVAIDRDIGVPNGIRYSFISDSEGCHGLFRIDESSGEVYTNTTNLDRDDKPINNIGIDGVCRLTLQAKEFNTSGLPQHGNDTTNTSFVITILDKNDNLPKFNSSVYQATVDENTTNIPLTMLRSEEIVVTDIDQTGNNEFEISVQYLNGSDFDGIKPEPKSIRGGGNIQLRLTNEFKFDFEVNQTAEYRATDLDSGMKGNITFTLGGDPHFSVSKLNATTAEIRTVNVTSSEGVLDRETRDKYYLTIEATDGEGGRSNARINVFITDLNDNPPVFVQGYRQFSVKENKPTFDGEIVINATDNDQKNLSNSQVRYKLHTPSYLENNFTIDIITGNITLSAEIDFEGLDRNDSRVTLIVEAYDLGYPSMSTNESIYINFQDVNDNFPEFKNQTFIMTLEENADSGTHVGTVSATDKDGTPTNSKLTYYIDKGDREMFRMNRATGDITVDHGAKIDREEHKVYNITVLAIDRGTPSLNSSALLFIYIIDQNDARPTFNKSMYVASVNESADSNTTFTVCPASDADLNSLLVYSIIEAVPTYSPGAMGNESAEVSF